MKPKALVDKGKSGTSMVELLASLSIATAALAFMLGGLRSLSTMAAMHQATGVVRDAVDTARRRAYLRAETANVSAGRNDVSVSGPDGADAVRQFALPTGFVIANATRGGEVRFFADGLSDNASVTIAHETSGATSTLFIDSRGETR